MDYHVMWALRGAAKSRMSIFHAALQEHRHHAGFHAQTWAYSREMGFTCDCCGHDEEWRISITELRRMLPEARTRTLNFIQGEARRGNKQKKRAALKANRKAKALLFRYLTKEQKWTLKAEKAFYVTGQDGVRYRITEGTCNNVYKLDKKGQATHSYCVIAEWKTIDGMLPVYDLMLLQKLYLEGDPEPFKKKAIVKNLRTKRIYQGGGLAGQTDGYAGMDNRPVPELDLTVEQLDNPEPWVREQLQEAMENQA